MYIRFIIDLRDPDSERYTGIFHAASELRDNGELEEWEQHELQNIRDWFNDHLDRPTNFSRTKLYSVSTKKRGISWFKDTANDHISKAQEMAKILGRHGIPVVMLKTERVGYVVYEDRFQIVAEPFADVAC